MIVSLVLRACGKGQGAREVLNVSDAARAFSGEGRGKPFRADQNEMKTRGAFSAKVETGFAFENAAENLERQIRSMAGPATSCCRAFQGPNMRKCIASHMQPSLVRTWIDGQALAGIRNGRNASIRKGT